MNSFLTDVMHRDILNGDALGILDEQALIEVGDCEAIECDIACVRNLHATSVHASANNCHRLPWIRADEGMGAGGPCGAVDVDILLVHPGFDVQSIAARDVADAIRDRAPWIRGRAI